MSQIIFTDLAHHQGISTSPEDREVCGCLRMFRRMLNLEDIFELLAYLEVVDHLRKLSPFLDYQHIRVSVHCQTIMSPRYAQAGFDVMEKYASERDFATYQIIFRVSAHLQSIIVSSEHRDVLIPRAVFCCGDDLWGFG